MSSLRSNFIWNSSYQVVRILTPLITTPYLARVLGSDALGTFSYTCTVATYFTYFCLLGLGQYGNREIAKVRDDRAARSQVFCSIFAMQVAVGAIVFTAYLLYVFFISGSLLVYSLIWSFWVLAEVVDISWYFYGIEDFKEMTIRNLLVRVGVIVSIFAFVHEQGDLAAYCLIQATGFVVNSGILWVLLRGRVDIIRPKVQEVLVHFKPNLTLFAPVIAISIYTQLNEIILGNVSGMSQVAFYDNAYKIVTIPLAIIQSLGTVMLPRMSTVAARRNEDAAQRYLSLSSWISQALSFGLMFGIIGVSHEFVPVFFGDGFELCETLMPLLSLIIPICAWSSLLGNQFLIPYERDGQYLISVLVGAGVNVLLCALLVGDFGAIGAAIATVAAELVVSVSQSILVGRALPLCVYLKGAIPFAVIGFVECALVRLVGITFGPTAFGLSSQIVIGAASYLLFSLSWLKITHDKRLGLLLRR